MVNVEFLSPAGRPFRLDSGKIIAVTAQADTSDGRPRCLIYVAGLGELSFPVDASLKDVLTRLEQKNTETDRHFVHAQEALDLFGEIPVPSHFRWRAMSFAARVEWDRRYHMTGMASFCCLTCGYPSGGTSTCPACRPEKEEIPS